MKKSLYLTVAIGLALCLHSCINFFGSNYGYSGEISRGTKGRSSRSVEAPPYGMVYVPSGAFALGSNDQDIMWAMNANTRTITVNAFWMDQTEITNYEYRQFISYVRDSISRALIGNVDESFFISEEEDSDIPEKRPLDWTKRMDLRKNPDARDALRDLYYQGREAFTQKEIDVRKLLYDYSWIDYQQASKVRYDPETKQYVGSIINARGEREEVVDRSSFIIRNAVYVYPDTLCWIRDFTFAYNDPLAISYFSHFAYNDYPVVGINWNQATAFCYWRTEMLHNASKGTNKSHLYRLPSESEWEYAARGGLASQLYPWGGPYTTNKEGCFLANFKPQRGKYSLDGGVYTMPVGSYEPNDYGLYDMAGNVSEWTSDTYDENSYSYSYDLAPNYKAVAKASDPAVRKRKVTRGGSWKDISYFMQCGTRSFEYQDSTHCFVGFRCVRSYMGSR